jgi:predicted class III extradiol MEMO1 family dioxygenase
MDILALEPGNGKTADQAHSEFENYLIRTKNTICGRHPIGVLFGALAGIQESRVGDAGPKDVTLRWVQYAQSSSCWSVQDSSVSYASAYVVI